VLEACSPPSPKGRAEREQKERRKGEMKTFKFRNWKAVLALCIVVPVSLFLAFQLRSMPRSESITVSETITADTVSWNMSRPTFNSYSVDINYSARNFCKDTDAFAALNINVLKYYEDDPDYPSWGNDYVKLRVTAEANTSNGFIYSMAINSSRTEADALLKIALDPRDMHFENLVYSDKRLWTAPDDREAHLDAYGVGKPANCSLSILAYWIFIDENINHEITDHKLTVTHETTYYNGTAYRKMIIPIELECLKP